MNSLKNIAMENNEPDYESDEYFEGCQEADEPDFYECMCCGNVQGDSGFGMTCDKCMGPVSEGYF